jgi:hypothetical protein
MSNEKTVESVEGLVDHGKKHNRSSALSPTQMAEVTEETSKVAKEAAAAGAASVVAMLAPFLEQLAKMPEAMKAMAITPEQIQAIRTPYVDPSTKERETREGQATRDQDAELKRNIKKAQEQCTHTDKNRVSCINLIHNFHDHQPRGICVHCYDLIHPREWRVGAPDPKTGKLRTGLVDFRLQPDAMRVDPQTGQPAEYVKGAYLVEAHKDYHRVMQQERETDNV